MKKLLIYHTIIFVPMGLLALGAKLGWISSMTFGISLMIYAFLYHPYVSGSRLVEGGIIRRSELWKNFIPGWNSRYFSYLFFNKPVM